MTSFYEAGQATFESLATLLQCSVMELWGMLTGGHYCEFVNFSGAAIDAETETNAAAEAQSILLDITAVLTFGHLGLLGSLAKRYKLYTTQPVLDVIWQERKLGRAGLIVPPRYRTD